METGSVVPTRGAAAISKAAQLTLSRRPEALTAAQFMFSAALRSGYLSHVSRQISLHHVDYALSGTLSKMLSMVETTLHSSFVCS